jgi:hypothetical protein
MPTPILCSLLLAASVALAQDIAELLPIACEDGKVEGNSCSKCPNSSPGSWFVRSLTLGHFSSPTSEEAIITSGNCYDTMPGMGISVLLGKRNGKWTKLEDSLASQSDVCTLRHQTSGRDYLTCESTHYSRDGEVTQTLGTMTVANEAMDFHLLFTAVDNTASCFVQGLVEKAEIKDIDFRDLNGDGLDDISITATYGSFKMTNRLREQCSAAFADRVQTTGTGTKPYPEPAAIKTYKIQFLFDGLTYHLTPASLAAAQLFDPNIDHNPPPPPPPTTSITTATAQPLGTPGTKPGPTTLQEFCGSPLVNGACTKPLSHWEKVGNWTLREYRPGHFISPSSEDAMVTAVTPGRKDPTTALLTKNDGKWETVPAALISSEDLHDCIMIHLKTCLDRLACLDTTRTTGYRAGLFITATIKVLTGAGPELMFRDLIHSANNLTACSAERPEDDPIENSVFDKMEAGPGPDLIITARYGERDSTQETERQCNAAVAKKPGAKFPAPRLLTYKLEYYFDVLPLKESEGTIPTPQTKEKASNYFYHLTR